MKYRSLIIVVEGQTEEEFVNETFAPWLNSQGIFDVRAIKIRTSKTGKGGNTNYAHFQNTTEILLKQEKDVLVTSLVDFFRLPNEFPGFEEAKKISSTAKRVEFLEQELGKDIGSGRFIPYIQLHEFEAFLFTKSDGFGVIPSFGPKEISAVGEIIRNYPNPELINDHPDTAPSKRLEKLVLGYNKVLHGNFVILENGLPIIFEKCPRFRHWAQSLVERMKSAPILTGL